MLKNQSGKKIIKVPVEISARHVHLCQKDLDMLFGFGFKLDKLKDLSQKGEFAAKQTVELTGPKASFREVRIVGPVRKNTQVEITATDGRILGLEAPVRISGDTVGSATAIIAGPKGRVKLKEAVIIAKRHLHLSISEAKKLGLKNNQKVSIKILGERSATFHQVIVRVGENFSLSCHIDTDEANSAGLKSCGYGELIK